MQDNSPPHKGVLLLRQELIINTNTRSNITIVTQAYTTGKKPASKQVNI